MRRAVSSVLSVLLALAISVSTAETVSAAPGTLVRSTSLPADLWLPGTARAHHVTYYSTGMSGERVPVTGAVFIPEGAAPPGGWPVLAWAHGTVGLGDTCAPTVAGRSNRDIEYLTHWLREGYAIVATDYMGLGTPGLHPYLVGEFAAYSVIDSVRAASTAEPSLSSRWAVIGQSQGGHAAMFTAHLAPSYAPDMDFRGAVGTGVPSQLEYLISALGPWFPDINQPGLTVFVTYVLASLRATYPETDIDSYLTELGREVVDSAEELCYFEQLERVRGIGMGRLFSRQLTDAPFFGAIRDALEVPTSGYHRPVFIGQGTHDSIVWAPLTEILSSQLRSTGQPATVRYYAGENHDSTMAASLTDTTPFLARLMR